MKLSTILDQIDIGSIALPEFQRGFVWNRGQVRSFMYSLYRKHPVGSLLVWVTKTEEANVRGNGDLPPGTVKLLLDGQQRITSLYGIINGKPPKFFEGNERAFMDLYFHLTDEVFEFFMPNKMRGNPLWVSVTDVMKLGAGEAVSNLYSNEDLREQMPLYTNRLTAFDAIKDRDFHIEEVSGEGKTVDIVVDIFNRVNSGGTKLSKGDLALAKICAEWPDARKGLNKRLDKWRNAGFYFKLEWLIRCVNSVITGEAYYTALDNVEPKAFEEGLGKTEKAIDKMLNLISSRLGLDHERVLGSRYSFPLMVRYLSQNNQLDNSKERDKLLYWYIHTFLWGRYSGSTESVLNQDLNTIKESEGALDRLVDSLRQIRGDLKLNPEDFGGWSQGARFYPLLYMLTRVWHAKDWMSGIELSNALLGRTNQLQIHHIFPKARLYKNKYDKMQVNAIANFTFLTQDTNLAISDKNPEEYLEELVEKNPDAVKSHWMPMDRNLWKIENYLDFLKARQELLASAANDFLDHLLDGTVPESEEEFEVLEQDPITIPGGISDEDEQQLIIDCNIWVIEQGLPEGEFLYELTDEKTNKVLSILDLAWPDGLQMGLSQPVALLIDEGNETINAVNEAGYRFFTEITEFKKYVQDTILISEEVN